MSNTKIRIVVVGLVVILALAQFLFDPISSIRQSLTIASVRSQFSDAQSKWSAAGFEDYSFEIHGRSQNICIVDAQIKVEDNAVTKVLPLNSTFLLAPEQWADPDWGNEVFICDYNHFTIPRMFEMFEKTLQNSPTSILEAEFDPQYGFITRFKDGIFNSNGWFSAKATSVYNEFQVSNFKLEK